MNIYARAMTDLEQTVKERHSALKQYERDIAKSVARETGCNEWLVTNRCDRTDECFCLKAAKAVLAVRKP